MERTPYPTPRRGLNADEIAQLQAEVERRVRAEVDKLSRDDWTEGMAWYFDAHRYIKAEAERRGVDGTTAAWVTAILSPQNAWEQNCQDLIDMLEQGECGALSLGVDRAVDILGNGADPEQVAGGRKVRAFGRNLANPWGSLDVTLDSHMAQFLQLPGLYKYLERVGIYDAISDVFRQVADDHGILPHQLQAALWVRQRGKETTA